MYSVMSGYASCGGGISADSIPRYAIPDYVYYKDEKCVCEDCIHMVEVKLGNAWYQLCVQERDESQRSYGEVYEIDYETFECKHWEECE